MVSRYSYRQTRNRPVLPVMKDNTDPAPYDFSQVITSASRIENPPVS